MGIASFLLALCDIFLFLSVIDFVDSSKTRLPTNFNENIFLKKLREKRDAANTISVKVSSLALNRITFSKTVMSLIGCERSGRTAPSPKNIKK